MKIVYWYCQPQVEWRFFYRGKRWLIVQKNNYEVVCVSGKEYEELRLDLGSLALIAGEQWYYVVGVTEFDLPPLPKPGSIAHCWGATAYTRKPPY